jgi:hypothetical protein
MIIREKFKLSVVKISSIIILVVSYKGFNFHHRKEATLYSTNGTDTDSIGSTRVTPFSHFCLALLTLASCLFRYSQNANIFSKRVS